ncbi:MAG: BatD family protein [Bacteroidetes bacterium]|nr:BatD family protein [Bacteroidota bacterium]
MANCNYLFGQEINTKLEIKQRQIAHGDVIDLEFVFQGNRPDSFAPPKFPKELRLEFVQKNPSEHRVTINNMPVEVTFKYLCKVRVLKPGKFTIPAGNFYWGGRNFTTEKREIEVVDRNVLMDLRKARVANRVFIRATLSNDSPFVGQQVRVVYKVYSSLNLEFMGIKMPEMKSFNQEIVSDKRFTAQREMLNNQLYVTYLVTDRILFANDTGVQKIAPMYLNLKVAEPSRHSHRLHWFDYELSSDELVVYAKPLPKPKPKDFSGLVGNFKLNVSLSDSNTDVNKLLNYKMVLKGLGNIRAYSLPNFSGPIEIEKHEPEKQSNFFLENNLFGGIYHHTYPLVATQNGRYRITGFTLTYFNPDSVKYVTEKASDLILQVGEFKPLKIEKTSAKLDKSESDFTNGDDIRFIHKNNIDLQIKGSQFFGSIGHILATSAPFALLLLAFFGYRRKQQSVQLTDQKQPYTTVSSTNHINAARSLFQSGEKDLAMRELLNALADNLSSNYAIARSEMVPEKMALILKNKGVNQIIISQLLAVWNELEMMQYTPIAVEQQEAYFNKVEQLIIDLK